MNDDNRLTWTDDVDQVIEKVKRAINILNRGIQHRSVSWSKKPQSLHLHERLGKKMKVKEVNTA